MLPVHLYGKFLISVSWLIRNNFLAQYGHITHPPSLLTLAVMVSSLSLTCPRHSLLQVPGMPGPSTPTCQKGGNKNDKQLGAELMPVLATWSLTTYTKTQLKATPFRAKRNALLERTLTSSHRACQYPSPKNCHDNTVNLMGRSYLLYTHYVYKSPFFLFREILRHSNIRHCNISHWAIYNHTAFLSKKILRGILRDIILGFITLPFLFLKQLEGITQTRPAKRGDPLRGPSSRRQSGCFSASFRAVLCLFR